MSKVCMVKSLLNLLLVIAYVDGNSVNQSRRRKGNINQSSQTKDYNQEADSQEALRTVGPVGS